MFKKAYFLFIFCLFVEASFSLDLNSGYKDIKLGMSKDQVSGLLKKSVDFDAQREEVLSIRLEPDSEIISAKGRGYINRAYFHFSKGVLFQIFMLFDHKKIDYYSLLKNNTKKYGNPQNFDPESSSWENKEIKIVIEKPSSIKYLFLPIWNDLIKKDSSPDDLNLEMRNKFIDNL